MFRLTSLATALLSLFMLSAPASAYEAITGPLGLLAYDKAKAYDGYTLFTPHTKVSSWIVDKIQDPGSRKTYLIDMEGNIVHTWKHDHPAFYAELIPNGNLLRAEKIAGSPVNFGGWYGLLREYAWDGKVVWEYKVSNPRQIAHHGFDRLPNGNTAILIWENKTYDEALAKGRDPKDKALSRNGMPAPGQGPDGQPSMTADGETVPAQRASWARASLLQPFRSQRTVSADADTGEAVHTGIGPPDAPRRDLAEPVRHQPERAYGKAIAGGTVPTAQQHRNGQEQQAQRQTERNGDPGRSAGQPEDGGDCQHEPKENRPEARHPTRRRDSLAPGGRHGIPDPEIAQVTAPRSPGQQYGDAEQNGHEQPAATV